MGVPICFSENHQPGPQGPGANEATLTPSPRKGVPAGVVRLRPLVGVLGAARFGTPFFHCEASPMATPDDAELTTLIAEYGRLRCEEHQAFERIGEIHVRLRELECRGALGSEWSVSVLPLFIARISRMATPDDIKATLDDTLDDIEAIPYGIEETPDDIVVTPDDIELAKLVFEYENLRDERCRAYEWIGEIHVRLIELERKLLPDSYIFPGDSTLR